MPCGFLQRVGPACSAGKCALGNRVEACSGRRAVAARTASPTSTTSAPAPSSGRTRARSWSHASWRRPGDCLPARGCAASRGPARHPRGRCLQEPSRWCQHHLSALGRNSGPPSRRSSSYNRLRRKPKHTFFDSCARQKLEDLLLTPHLTQKQRMQNRMFWGMGSSADPRSPPSCCGGHNEAVPLIRRRPVTTWRRADRPSAATLAPRLCAVLPC